MKRHLSLILLALLPLFCHAQQADIKTHPRTTLLEARADLQKALRANDSPAILRAVLTEYQCWQAIDQDSVPAFITRMEALTRNNPRPVERSVLHSLLAVFYTNHYANIYHFLPPGGITGNHIPQDINQWTPALYQKKIMEHLSCSLAEEEILTATPVSAIAPLIEPGTDASNLNPTLFDFLAYRAIECVKEGMKYLLKDKMKLEFRPLEEFLQQQFDTVSPEKAPIAAFYYQHLLRSLVRRDAQDALLYAELRRQTDDDLYAYPKSVVASRRQLLQELWDKNKDNPLSVEIIHAIISRSPSSYWHSTPTPAELCDIEALCDEGIRRFPDYPRINQLRKVRSKYLAPRAFVEIRKPPYPGQPESIDIAFYNCRTISCSLYQLKEVELAEFSAASRWRTPHEKLFDTTPHVKNTPDVQNTTLLLPFDTPGTYDLVVRIASDSDILQDTLSFYCTRLISDTRRIGENTHEVLVRNRMSGHPVSGAVVKRYSKLGYGKFAYASEAITNDEGIALFHDVQEGDHYTPTQGEDTHGCFYYFSQYGHYAPSSTEKAVIFTDRNVYRFGDTVHFKAIFLQGEEGTPRVIPDRPLTIALYNANTQQIAACQLTTNAYGSVAGRFALPLSASPGAFSIRIGDDIRFFKVAHYQRPNINVTFEPLQTAYQIGDKLLLCGTMSHFSGTPADSCQATYTVYAHYRHDDEDLAVATDTLFTDTAGRFSIPVVSDHRHFPNLRFQPTPPTYTVRMKITAPNGETRLAEHAITFQEQPYSIELPAQTQFDKSSPIRIAVNTRNGNEERTAQTLRYTVEQLVLSPNVGHDYEQADHPAQWTWAEGVIYTTADPASQSAIHLDADKWPSGVYRLTLTGQAGKHQAMRQQILYLYDKHDPRPPYPTRLWCAVPQDSCLPGEDVEFILGTSLRDACVQYNIFAQGEIVHQEQLFLSNESRILRIPNRKEFGSRCHVDLTLVKDDRRIEKHFDIRQAYPPQELNIVARTFRDHLRPGQQEEWTFSLETPQGETAQAEVMATLYDAATDAYRESWKRPFSISSYPHQLPYWDCLVAGTPEMAGYIILQAKLSDFHVPDLNLPQWKDDPLDYRWSSRKIIPPRADSVPIVSPAVPAPVSLPSAKDAQTNFNETAFFQPQLQTDEQGEATIHFSLPESTTTWRLRLFAHTPDMRHRFFEREIITSKPLMVSAHCPAPVREGDRTQLRATLFHQKAATRGKITLEIFDPDTGEVLLRQRQAFRLPEQGSQTVAFTFDMPTGHRRLAYRVVAKAGKFSDGEQRLLPVVPVESTTDYRRNFPTPPPHLRLLCGANNKHLSSICRDEKPDKYSINAPQIPGNSGATPRLLR